MRVLNRNVKQISEDYYLITIEAGTAGVAASGHAIKYVLARIPQAPAFATVEASDDGVTWTVIVPDMLSGSIASTLWEVPTGEENHRYWSMHVVTAHGGGFFIGYVQTVLRLLDEDGVDALGTLGQVDGTGPPIPWAITLPVALIGPSIPYTATTNGDKAKLRGSYHNTEFRDVYPGPQTGDYTIAPPQTDASFGLEALVTGAGTIEARWVWDLGE